MFAIPIFFGPILIDLIVGQIRGRSNYRASDLTTNLSLSMFSTLVGVAATAFTLGAYIYLHKEHALFELKTDSALTWVIAFVVYDFIYYCTHRAHHRVALLWAAHVVHHSGEDMNFGLALRQSVLSELTMGVFFLPMAVLGIAPEVYLGITALQLIYQYSIHNTYVGHLGVLERIFVTPSQHRVHHGCNRLYLDKNYGNVLVVWDRLLGTYQPELAAHPPVYGLREGVKSWNPLTINFQFLQKLLGKAKHSRGIRDKVRTLVKPPDWLPGYVLADPFRHGDEDMPSARFRKYDPKISPAAFGYVLFQFFMTFAAFVGLLWMAQDLQPVQIAALAGIIFVTALVIAGIQNGSAWFWHAELARLVAIAAAVLWGVMQKQLVGVTPAVFLEVYCAISLLYLFRFRLHFHPAGYQHDALE